MSKTATKSRPSATTRRSAPARRTQPRRRGADTASGKSKAAQPKTLSEFISARFEEFSRSQKDVARYIIDHLDEAAFQTAEELARRANTSSSTVVRFSQALGFDGYPELQQAAIEEYRGRSPDGGPTALFDFDHSEFEASLAADYANLESTARKLTTEHVEASIEALAAADRVVIVALEQMAFFASYMRQLLALLDIRAEVLASAGQDTIARVGRADDKSVVVTFTAGRAHPIIVRSLKLARRRGACTLAVTDATLSEVGEHADHTLYFSSNGPSYVRSTAALLALVHALTHGVYARDKNGFAERIRAFKLR